MARNALGRGLGALIREPEPIAPPAPPVIVQPAGPQEIDIDLIDPSPFQPRSRFREEQLDELARSIQMSGIIQPLVLRKVGARYQLIAGERRWRAAQRAGLHRVPAVLREVTDAAALELTLVENIQREDLNAVEEARAYARLLEEFTLTQEDVAQRTGKDRATIANAVRLLKLEAPILALIEDEKLTAGHGRALLAMAEPKERLALAKRAASGGMTVRQLERIAAGKGNTKGPKPTVFVDANTRAAIEELQRVLGTKVTLKPRSKRAPGQLILEYYSEDQLAGLYDRIMRSQ